MSRYERANGFRVVLLALALAAMVVIRLREAKTSVLVRESVGFYENYQRVMRERRKRAPSPPPKTPAVTRAELAMAEVGFWHPSGSDTPDPNLNEDFMEGFYDHEKLKKEAKELFRIEGDEETPPSEELEEETRQVQPPPPPPPPPPTHPLLEEDREEDTQPVEVGEDLPQPKAGIYHDPITGQSKTYEEMFPSEAGIDMSRLPADMIPNKPWEQLTAEERLNIRQKQKHDKYAP
eukprot:CAMPEP_0184479898 /NCGR_PEP_ID=MMETSP0113_2-20130426/1435_1 /TAXON_ID=91329 /ORGANISM="Norrisiella sphaerica, Strain BC52" /LENGTH=234 /DNA_ID=CAMNT_0026858063 /DNA_START=56 /DNA_END=760 /DNA_ORIENTATION=+